MSPVGYTLWFVFPSFFSSAMRHTILFMGSTIGEVYSKGERGFAAFRDLLTQRIALGVRAFPCLDRLCAGVGSIMLWNGTCLLRDFLSNV